MRVHPNSAPIVAHTAPRRGNPTYGEQEAASPTGRALHQLEGAHFTISTRALTYRSLAEIRQLHDTEHDRWLAIAEMHLEAGDTASALDAVRAAQAADALEDAAAVEGDGLVASIHAISRKVAGWIERSCVALRQREATR
jgi:hypothetical protein